ncbi:MAG: di-trans,poly-cis-decaprenylcistransferase [Candidatus Andersenbacteria bacterium RIFCSPHIGHO2_12_FULL_46_9]|nr:MAG: Tritrans,polycis-undecaprenyl-diphosphate synthase (geranylgeranyl-diphosphate specific) [Parcubacteria group bacterium GW2011_GWA2_45_14]OGY35645.1 MAG: di-trans,poly-cis-decaprenylcistransferase [Candidatus Andersenbacteria bacterium RIFCSPHIGHO2_02_FULL_46_16]OGY36847.1 MAG: di-trans,poly-cis-decaprenylcistransferase [Candidatus Andersenbacteria bacterium RIFCSPLOWO2_02_FULL_46_11]OGY38457.1 MAG: di-trans,poly-cis-decaprenylcistransferase [Candidatus Andersenbacteria bacterium RIFCSPH
MQKMIPTHVAIIPDGNRRWAKARGKRACFGHSRGVAAFEKIALYSFDQGVRCLSIWGMSLDNMQRRSVTEVMGLMKIFKKEFTRLAGSEEIHQREVQINVLGEWKRYFPRDVREAINKARKATRMYQKGKLNFLLVYNGTDEMIRAIQAIADAGKAQGVNVTANIIKQNLLTYDLSPVDLVIRTGGEPHLSNGFMMWDTADAELYFTDKYWPAFENEDYRRALNDYAGRRRRRGK